MEAPCIFFLALRKISYSRCRYFTKSSARTFTNNYRQIFVRETKLGGTLQISACVALSRFFVSDLHLSGLKFVVSRQGSRQDQLSLPESDVLPQKFDPDRQIPESGGTPQLSGSGPRNLATTGGYPNFGRKVRKVTPEPEISRYRPPGTLKSDPRNRVRNTPGTGSGTPTLAWKRPGTPETGLEPQN